MIKGAHSDDYVFIRSGSFCCSRILESQRCNAESWVEGPRNHRKRTAVLPGEENVNRGRPLRKFRLKFQCSSLFGCEGLLEKREKIYLPAFKVLPNSITVLHCRSKATKTHPITFPRMKIALVCFRSARLFCLVVNGGRMFTQLTPRLNSSTPSEKNTP